MFGTYGTSSPPEWFIAKSHNNSTYYVSNVDEDKHIATWTKKYASALKFDSSANANQFISKFLKNRKDVYVIHKTK